MSKETKRSTFSVIWKCTISLFTASLFASLIIIHSTMIADYLMDDIHPNENYYDLSFGIISLLCITVFLMNSIFVLILEILVRKFKWRRGLGEPIYGAIIGTAFLYLYAWQDHTVGTGFYPVPSEHFNYYYPIVGFIIGAASGYIYYWSNKRLNNL